MFSKYIIHITFALENFELTFQQKIQVFKAFVNRAESDSALCPVNFHQKMVEAWGLLGGLILKTVTAFSTVVLEL